MAKLEELNKLLTESAEVLVECCSIIKEEGFNPEENNIYKLGKAIFEINEIREQIYRSNPELKPKKWGKPLTNEDFNEMFQIACEMSKEQIESGNIKKAIETFEKLIFIGVPAEYEKLANNEIVKIKDKHNV